MCTRWPGGLYTREEGSGPDLEKMLTLSAEMMLLGATSSLVSACLGAKHNISLIFIKCGRKEGCWEPYSKYNE